MSPQDDPQSVDLIEDREPLLVLSIRGAIALTQLTEAQGERLRELWQLLRSQGVAPLGPPFVRYHTFGETETDMEVGVPVSQSATGAGRITAGKLPGGLTISTWHVGPHDGLGEAYGRLSAWLKEHQRHPAGAAWEVYCWIDLSQEPDPSTWPPPAHWRTELVQPVA